MRNAIASMLLYVVTGVLTIGTGGCDYKGTFADNGNGRSEFQRGVTDASLRLSRGEVLVISHETKPLRERLDNLPNLEIAGCDTPMSVLLEASDDAYESGKQLVAALRERVPELHDYFSDAAIEGTVPRLVECYGMRGSAPLACAFLLPMMESRELDAQYVGGFNHTVMTYLLEMNEECHGIEVEKLVREGGPSE